MLDCGREPVFHHLRSTEHDFSPIFSPVYGQLLALNVKQPSTLCHSITSRNLRNLHIQRSEELTGHLKKMKEKNEIFKIHPIQRSRYLQIKEKNVKLIFKKIKVL
ncbi:unnamed protein product [Rhizophagus irregularis]|nr:unnamed protein product [Rhizophagus irregularis]CAB5354514.1 unnamed protein product [Rhizophagus irregularis]